MFAILRHPLLAVIVVAATAGSCDAATAEESAAANEKLAAVTAAKVASPSVHGAFAADSAAQIHAARGDSSVDIRLSKVMQSVDQGQGDVATLSIALVGSAPLASDGGDTSLASLDGLAGGTTIGLQLSGLSIHGAKTPSTATFDAKACKAMLAARYAAYKIAHPDVDVGEIHCETGKFYDALEKGLISPEEFKILTGVFYAPAAGMSSWSLTAKAGYVDSSWYDPTTLAKTKGREDQWSASGQFGYAWLNQPTPVAVVATLSAQAAPKSATSRTACLSTLPEGQTLLTCATGPIGAPTRKTTEILSLEARAAFSSRYAAELQVARDLRNHLTAVHVPMYFIPSDKTGLSGGIVLGWTSEDHKASLGIFVGQSFSLL